MQIVSWRTNKKSFRCPQPNSPILFCKASSIETSVRRCALTCISCSRTPDKRCCKQKPAEGISRVGLLKRLPTHLGRPTRPGRLDERSASFRERTCGPTFGKRCRTRASSDYSKDVEQSEQAESALDFSPDSKIGFTQAISTESISLLH